MKISFVERGISAGPLTVLKHLYYYTVQYGLSVKQFTGAHQDYWEALPRVLREARSGAKLSAIIHELEQLAVGAEQRRQKRRAQRKEWENKEVIINAQLSAILAALPGPLLANTVRHLTPRTQVPDTLHLVDLHIAAPNRQDRDFVEPDVLLLGDDFLLMAELKTKGGPDSSRRYPPQQLLNYARLALECERLAGAALPRRFAHLVVTPTSDLHWLEDYPSWVIGVSDSAAGMLRVNAEGLINLGRRMPPERRRGILSVLQGMPIYYRAWENVVGAFKAAVGEFADDRNRPHWRRIGEELEKLAKRASRFATRSGHGSHTGRAKWQVTNRAVK